MFCAVFIYLFVYYLFICVFAFYLLLWSCLLGHGSVMWFSTVRRGDGVWLFMGELCGGFGWLALAYFVVLWV